MKPVMQTRIGKTGNCFDACLASILEIPLEAVPDVMDDMDDFSGYWVKKYNLWLASEHNLYMLLLGIDTSTNAVLYHLHRQPCYHLIGGMSDRGIMHSVVGYHRKMVHDPHPDNTGLKTVVDYAYFVSLDPARTQRITDITQYTDSADCGSTHIKRNARSCLNFHGTTCSLCQVGELEARLKNLQTQLNQTMDLLNT